MLHLARGGAAVSAPAWRAAHRARTVGHGGIPAAPPPPRVPFFPLAMSDALGAFLADAKLLHFHGALVELGVGQPAHLEEADDADLEGIGMKSIEIRRLRRCMANATAAPGMMPKDGAQAPQVTQGQAVIPSSKVPEMIVPEWNPPVVMAVPQSEMRWDPSSARMVMTGAQEQPMQVPMMVAGAQYQSNYSLEWMTQENCCSDGGLAYTVCASTNDQNLIAQHVGITQVGQDYTNCCEMYCLRACGICGGLCTINGRANRLKKAFSDRHGLNHQPISMSTSCCCPETVFRQIKRKCITRSRLPSPSERPHLQFGRLARTSANECGTSSAGVRLCCGRRGAHDAVRAAIVRH